MSLWRPAPLTEAAVAARAAAEADRAARPDRYELDPETIGHVAARGTDGEHRFDRGWREGLEQYLGSAREDGRLNALGVSMVTTTAISRLRAGSTMWRFGQEHPEQADRPLLPPIFVTGGWRTGTTFLFRLLSTDARLRAPLPAELANPCRVATMTDDERNAYIQASSTRHDLLHALNPELRSIHNSGAWLPEECGLAMGTDLRNWAFPSTTRLDSYSRWLAGQDLEPAYVNYRKVLRALDGADGRRWVLKAPPHIAELDKLTAVFPGAVVVQMHRDIVETVASGASLFAVFRSTYSDEVDAVDVGRALVDQTELWFRRADAVRSAAAVEPEDEPEAGTEGATFVDIAYEDLVRDPVTAITAVYAAADLEPPDDPDALVARYHSTQPRHVHGTHRYAAADFGLDDGELRERFAFLGR